MADSTELAANTSVTSNKSSTEKNATPQQTYKIGEKVLCKVKGYPQWPGRTVDPEKAPKNVLKERPSSKTPFLVRFFGDPQYSWAYPRDLNPLSDADIKKKMETPKNRKLKEAYKIALDPKDWENDLEEMERQVEEAQEEQDELEAEGEIDEELVEAPPKKKRKAPAESEKKATPTAAEKRRKTASVEKSGNNNKQQKKKKEVLDFEVASEEEPESAKKPKEDAAHKEKEKSAEDEDPNAKIVRDWRNKLQRAFLKSEKELPKPEDMPSFDKVFTDIENFVMKADWLKTSKLNKVIRRIASLTSVPRDDEFNIKERSQKLIEKWAPLVSHESGGEEQKSSDTPSKPVSSANNESVKTEKETNNNTTSTEVKSEAQNSKSHETEENNGTAAGSATNGKSSS